MSPLSHLYFIALLAASAHGKEMPGYGIPKGFQSSKDYNYSHHIFRAHVNLNKFEVGVTDPKNHFYFINLSDLRCPGITIEGQSLIIDTSRVQGTGGDSKSAYVFTKVGRYRIVVADNLEIDDPIGHVYSIKIKHVSIDRTTQSNALVECKYLSAH